MPTNISLGISCPLSTPANDNEEGEGKKDQETIGENCCTVFNWTPKAEGILAWITSKVLDKILQLHLPLSFDVGAVHVCVEKDDGKCQDEDSVWVLKLADKYRVAHAVSLTVRKKEVHTPVEL